MDRKRDSVPGKKPRLGAGAATPHRLVSMAYDLAILACGRKDAVRSAKSIRRLRNLMRSVGPEDSSDLMVFYDWCLERIRHGEFEQAAQTLADLRKAWVEAERRFPG